MPKSDSCTLNYAKLLAASHEVIGHGRSQQTVRLTVRLTMDEIRKVRALAKQAEVSPEAFATWSVGKWLEAMDAQMGGE